MKIAIGSRSKLKESANVKAFQQVGLAAIFLLTDAPSWIPEEPLNPKETEIGAHNRADHALEAHPEAELGIGVENGIRVKTPAPGEHVLEPAYEDWAVVVIKDRHGCVVVTHSRAVTVPLEYVLASLAKRREVTVGKITTEHHPEVIHDNPHPFWSNGEFDREQLHIEAIVDGLCQFFNLPHPNSKKESTMTEYTHNVTIPSSYGNIEIKLPISEIKPGIWAAVFDIYGDHQMNKQVGLAMADMLKPLIARYPHAVLLMPEGKFPGAFQVIGDELRCDTVVARKTYKAYMAKPVLDSTGSSVTTEGEQTYYLCAKRTAQIKGHPVIVIDDVITKGGTVEAMKGLIEKAGGTYVGTAVVFAEGPAAQARLDVVSLGHLPFFNPPTL